MAPLRSGGKLGRRRHDRGVRRAGGGVQRVPGSVRRGGGGRRGGGVKVRRVPRGGCGAHRREAPAVTPGGSAGSSQSGGVVCCGLVVLVLLSPPINRNTFLSVSLSRTVLKGICIPFKDSYTVYTGIGAVYVLTRNAQSVWRRWRRGPSRSGPLRRRLGRRYDE